MGEGRGLIPRRTLAKGSAWAVPVIVAAAGTPALAAASVCTTTCADLTGSTGALDFGTGTTWNTTTNSFGNGWTGATSPTTAQFLGDTHISRSDNWTPGAAITCKPGQTACTTGTAVGGVTMIFSGDPRQANTTVSYTSKVFCLPKGKYTFSFNYSYIGCWFRSQILTAYLVDAGTGATTQVGTSVVAPAGSSPGHGTIPGRSPSRRRPISSGDTSGASAPNPERPTPTTRARPTPTTSGSRLRRVRSRQPDRAATAAHAGCGRHTGCRPSPLGLGA